MPAYVRSNFQNLTCMNALECFNFLKKSFMYASFDFWNDAKSSYTLGALNATK